MLKTPLTELAETLQQGKGELASTDIVIDAIVATIKMMKIREKQFAEECFEAGQNSIECYGGSITTYFSTFYKQYENE